MKKGQKQALAIGAGIAALAAAAAGTYFFAGKDGAKNRAKVSAWAEKAKKEVIKDMHKLQDVSKKTYDATVDTILDKYHDLKNVDSGDVKALAKELKTHWKSISGHLKEGTATAVKTVKKAVKAGKAVVASKPAKKAAAKKK